MLLTLDNVHHAYGHISALRGVSIDVEEADFIALIGANGAGKSTTLRSISGLEKNQKGRIVFDGESIEKLPADQVLKKGIALVPEGRRVFKDLSVKENLLLGAFTRNDDKAIQSDLKQVFAHFPRLQERKDQLARTMSGGEQQMLAIGRALMSRPKLLLLDEPSLGIAPIIVQEIGGILKDINAQGVAVVLVEQNAEMALRLANRGYVLETGDITLSGEASGLIGNDHVRKAYLGM